MNVRKIVDLIDTSLGIFREDVKIGTFTMYCTTTNITQHNNGKVMFTE